MRLVSSPFFLLKEAYLTVPYMKHVVERGSFFQDWLKKVILSDEGHDAVTHVESRCCFFVIAATSGMIYTQSKTKPDPSMMCETCSIRTYTRTGLYNTLSSDRFHHGSFLEGKEMPCTNAGQLAADIMQRDSVY